MLLLLGLHKRQSSLPEVRLRLGPLTVNDNAHELVQAGFRNCKIISFMYVYVDLVVWLQCAGSLFPPFSKN